MNPSKTEAYHLYGRTSYAQPLEFIERVTFPKGQLPEVPEGPEWVELIAFPEKAIIRVIPQPEESEA
jgi:hypothetical protein